MEISLENSKFKIISSLVVGLILLGAFLVITLDDERIVSFETEKEESVNGAVYFEGRKLGETKDGKLEVDRDKLGVGTLELNGTYKSRDYSFTFFLVPSKLEGEKINFSMDGDEVDSYIFHFYTNDTNEPLNGTFYYENKKMGEVRNGTISLPMDDISSGEIFLNGSYRDNAFEYSWKINREDLGLTHLDFILTGEERRKLMFSAESLNETKIEEEILRFTNRARTGKELVEEKEVLKVGNETIEIPDVETYEIVEPVRVDEFVPFDTKTYLDMNEELRADARSKSEEMVKEEYFSHESPSGEKVYDRLEEEEIFYITAGENIQKIPVENPNVTERGVALWAVKGWLESPGHRSLITDRDELYSDAGVGVSCNENSCYSTLVVAEMEKNDQIYMEGDYCYFISIYDPNYPFTYNTSVKVQLRATENLNSYIVPSEQGFDDCVDRDYIDSVEEFSDSDEFTTNITAEAGYGLVLETDQGTNITTNIQYGSSIS